MPGLLHDYLKQATDGTLTTRIDRRDLEALRASDQVNGRSTSQAIAGGALFFSGALMTALETGPWFAWGASPLGLLSLAAGAWLLVRAIRG
jgi:hypothetical protein